MSQRVKQRPAIAAIGSCRQGHDNADGIILGECRGPLQRTTRRLLRLAGFVYVEFK